MWLPQFACPCGRRLAVDSTCASCGTRIESDQGLFRCVRAERLLAAEAFLAQYRAVREHDGYRIDRAEYYRSLPHVPPDDPQWRTWRIRQQSFRRVSRLVRARRATARPTVLDLGAGSAWLSHRLAKMGCRPVAVDLLADDRDGLGARSYYDESFACVQADFDALPFAPHQFDVVVFNGSLHYAPDVAVTLGHACRMLTPRGALVVVDSPIFDKPGDGVAMRARNRERMRAECGVAAPIEPGEGFLTSGRLVACAMALGVSSRFFPSSGDLRQRLRRLASAFTGPVPARFGVWVAT